MALPKNMKLQLAAKAKELQRAEDQPQPVPVAPPRVANPPRGERGGFLNVTVTLPPEVLTALKALGVRRRIAGDVNSTTSDLVREAVADYLVKHQ